jgi:dimeric dUTPase (all-alpha-NTP-PPase superfamily)
MHQQLLEMLELQDSMNAKVHAKWREQNFDWYRAIWTECAEMLEHYGWKWWKKFDPDMPQVQLEVVDIWHFGMSLILQSTNKTMPQIAADIEPGFVDFKSQSDLRLTIEQVASKAVSEQSFDVALFVAMMSASNMSFADLYRHYIGKNVLNFFRQDHGYKDGSYIKIWQGREDNEHLFEVLEEISPDAQGFRDEVYRALEHRYPS